jgi:hypothetical protein
LQSLSNQLHDFNVGMGPDVGTGPGGNNFGTRVFWTAVVPDDAIRINPLAGTAEMHVHNLAALDYPEDFASGSLGPNWQTAYVPATVSFDVVWSRPVTQLVAVRDATDKFAGIFAENQATVTWSAHSASGFRFDSRAGNASTSTPGTPDITTTYFFAQVGYEQNGIFFPGMSGSEGPAVGAHGGSANAGPHTAGVFSLPSLREGPGAGISPGTATDAGSLGGTVVVSLTAPATTRSIDGIAQVFAEMGSLPGEEIARERHRIDQVITKMGSQQSRSDSDWVLRFNWDTDPLANLALASHVN